MDHENCRNAILKLLMHRLMAPYSHTQPCANTSSDNGKQQ